jgi:hypothetical protein
VERIPAIGSARPAQLIPIRFIFTNKVGKHSKLLLAFDALVLSETLRRKVGLGKIIHGDNYSMLKVKIVPLASKVRNQIDKIDALLGFRILRSESL